MEKNGEKDNKNPSETKFMEIMLLKMFSSKQKNLNILHSIFSTKNNWFACVRLSDTPYSKNSHSERNEQKNYMGLRTQ